MIRQIGQQNATGERSRRSTIPGQRMARNSRKLVRFNAPLSAGATPIVALAAAAVQRSFPQCEVFVGVDKPR